MNEPALLPDLVDFLRAGVDAILVPMADGELEVSLLGSYARDPLRMELYLRLRAWEAARGGATAELVD